MHQKLTEHGKYWMQNNQLPTKIPVELKDNSYELLTLFLVNLMLCNMK